MSVDESAPTKLSDQAEALLANWELVDRDWEASAAVIESKLVDITSGSTDAALLQAPLPREADEGEIVNEAPVSAPTPVAEAPQPVAAVVAEEPAEAAAVEAKPAAEAAVAETAPTAATTPLPGPKPQSLAEMARASVSRSSTQKEAAEIAKETLAVASMRRGPSAEVVERVQAASARKPMQSNPTLEEATERSPRTSGVVERIPQKSKANMAPLYGAAVAVLGIAAAIGLFVRSRGEAPTQVATQDEHASVEAIAPPASPPNTVAQKPELAARPTPAEAAPAAAPPTEAMGAAAPAAPLSKEKLAVAKPGSPAAAPAGAPSTAAGPAPEKIVLEEDAPAAPPATPAPAAPSAKAEPPMRPADGTAGSIPQKPSIGAVSAAIGAVMGGARSCVAGQKEASFAQVVFGSDGTVQSVSVSGPAASTGASACIQGALKKARMQPFAVPTFSTAVTIRPP